MAAAWSLMVATLAGRLWRERGGEAAGPDPGARADAADASRGDEEARLAEQLLRETRLELDLAQEALQNAIRLNRNLIEAMPGKVVYWDRDLRCRFANRHFAQEVDIDARALIGLSLEEVHGRALAPLLAPQLTAALAGQAQHFISEMPNRDGTPAVHRVHYLPDAPASGSPPGQPPGLPLGVCVAALDITAETLAQREREDTQALLALARDEAQAANRAKNTFLEDIGQEVRTPLNAILGQAFVMTRENRDSRQTERLEKVNGAARQLLQVVDDLVDLSHIESGQRLLEQAEFSVETWLARAIDSVKGRARDKGLELILDPDRLPRRLSGDMPRLSRILVDILSRAIDATETGWVHLHGEVTAETGTRMLVRFEVRDTGPGLPAERRKRPKPLVSAVTTVTQPPGLGLGLALSRRLAMAMGGDVGVETEGAGSTFWFTAWLARVPGLPDASVPLQRTGLRALLVDDLEESRGVLGERLRLLGFDVDAFGRGADLLSGVRADLACGGRYDVMLIDWDAEIMGGVAASSSLREWLGDATPPAILMTASADAEVAWHAESAAFCATLVKPIMASALHDTLVEALRSRARAPSFATSLRSTAPSGDWFERAQAIEGLNIATALQFVGGGTDTLARVLQIFASSYGAACPGLLDSTGGPDAVRERRLAICHTTVATLSVIGATELVAQVNALDAGLRAASATTDDKLTADCEALHTALRRLVRAIDHALLP